MKYSKIVSVVVLIVAIASAAVIYYNPSLPPEKPKPKARDYFVFDDLGAEVESANGTDNIVRIRTFHVRVMPIKGDAISFHIDPGGGTMPEDYWFPEITNGTKQDIQVQFTSPIQSVKNGTTFPIRIKVYCEQTDDIDQYVTLQIPQENIDIY
jgi:hypothetical protein